MRFNKLRAENLSFNLMKKSALKMKKKIIITSHQRFGGGYHDVTNFIQICKINKTNNIINIITQRLK